MGRHELLILQRKTNRPRPEGVGLGGPSKGPTYNGMNKRSSFIRPTGSLRDIGATRSAALILLGLTAAPPTQPTGRRQSGQNNYTPVRSKLFASHGHRPWFSMD